MQLYGKEREPQRVQYAFAEIEKLGYKVTMSADYKVLYFTYKNELIRVFPYTGWHTGKSIKDGRGIKNLLKQIKPQYFGLVNLQYRNQVHYYGFETYEEAAQTKNDAEDIGVWKPTNKPKKYKKVNGKYQLIQKL